MAVQTVEKTFKGRTASGSMDERTYVELYDVFVDDPLTDSPEDARLATGIPRVGDDLVQVGVVADENRICVRTSAEQDESNPQLYRVLVEYSTTNEDATGQDIGRGNPLLVPPQISVGFEARREPIQEAPVLQALPSTYLTEAIQSTAGERFDPPLEVDVFDMVIVYVRNEGFDATGLDDTQFSIPKCLKFQGKTNLNTWNTFNPGEARCEITAERAWEGGTEYWQVVYRFVIRQRTHPASEPIVSDIGWDEVLVNEGTRQLRTVQGDQTLLPIYVDEIDWAPSTPEETQEQKDRIPATSPHPLSIGGQVLAPNPSTGEVGPVTYVPRTSPPSTILDSTYQIYDRVDFSTLGITF